MYIDMGLCLLLLAFPEYNSLPTSFSEEAALSQNQDCCGSMLQYSAEVSTVLMVRCSTDQVFELFSEVVCTMLYSNMFPEVQLHKLHAHQS